MRDGPDIVIEQTWHWTCWSCPWRDGAPTAYGTGETFAEVADDVAHHKRVVSHA